MYLQFESYLVILWFYSKTDLDRPFEYYCMQDGEQPQDTFVYIVFSLKEQLLL